MGMKIGDLPAVAEAELAHRIPASKDGATSFLTVEQIRAKAGTGSVGGDAISADSLEQAALLKKIGGLGTKQGSGERVLLGVLRQNSEGSGWAFLDDTDHARIGFASVSQDANGITLSHGFTGTKVRSLLAVPDETFAVRGLAVGASVGLSSSVLWLGLPLSVALRMETSADVVTEVIGDPAWTVDQFAVAHSAGTMTITHPAVYDIGVAPIVNGIRQSGSSPPIPGIPVSGGFGGVGNETKFGVEYVAPMTARARWTSGTAFTVDTDFEGTFSATFSAGTLTVAHPAATMADDLILSSEGYRFQMLTKTTTGFTGQFLNAAGSVVTTPDSSCTLTFLRAASLAKRKTRTDRHWVSFSRGYAKANPNKVWSTTGNIWLFGVLAD
ncbi:hypothetical protein [Gellertiella hungarica]|uniref:Uncharacterized protein n=1 Tax=Gellertiella hungarica TaxID=1572859 RepID=A0A7W6NJP0_9HYPH|nr:hypothetical protein [Gellertiella hungarica]MBB4063699.1 hypothetical protein [Gellertiella hungarica]